MFVLFLDKMCLLAFYHRLLSIIFSFAAYVFSAINSHLAEGRLWGRKEHKLCDSIFLFFSGVDGFKVPQSNILGTKVEQILRYFSIPRKPFFLH